MKKGLILTQQFTTPLFQFENLKLYTLYLEINEHYFCCWAKEKTDSEVHWLEYYTVADQEGSLLEKLQALYTTHRLLASIKWNSIRVSFDNQEFTHIPLALFQKEYATQYLQLAKGNALTVEQEVYVNHMTQQGVAIIFAENSHLYHWISEQYPFVNISFQHLSTIICDYLLLEKSTTIKAHLHVYSNHFFLVIAQHGELQFCNRFAYQTSEELVFFALYAINELGFAPEEVSFTLIENTINTQLDYQVLSDYIPVIQLQEAQDALKAPFFSNQFIPHYS